MGTLRFLPLLALLAGGACQTSPLGDEIARDLGRRRERLLMTLNTLVWRDAHRVSRTDLPAALRSEAQRSGRTMTDLTTLAQAELARLRRLPAPAAAAGGLSRHADALREGLTELIESPAYGERRRLPRAWQTLWELWAREQRVVGKGADPLGSGLAQE